MALYFSGNSNVVLPNWPTFTPPFTLSCWINYAAWANGCLITISGNTTTDGFMLYIPGASNASGGGQSRQGGFAANFQATTGISALNYWYHLAAVFASYTSRTIYWRGVFKRTDVTLSTPTITNTPYRILLGTGPGYSYTGKQASSAIWNTVLSDSDILSLSQGASPRMIQPSKLTMYNRGTVPLCPSGGMPGVFSIITLGVETNSFGGSGDNFYGARFQPIGNTGVVVTALGRWVLLGNSFAHTVKLVLNGVDVPGASVTINTAGKTPGQFIYAELPFPVYCYQAFYVVSEEISGKDTIYNSATIIAPAPFVTATGGVQLDVAVGIWSIVNTANRTFVPVSFKGYAATSPNLVGQPFNVVPSSAMPMEVLDNPPVYCP